MQNRDEFQDIVEELDGEKLKACMKKQFENLINVGVSEKTVNFLMSNCEKFVDNIGFLFEEASKVGITKKQFGQIYFSLVIETIWKDFATYYSFVESAALDSFMDSRVTEQTKKVLKEDKEDIVDEKDPDVDLLKKCSGGYKN